MKKLIVTDNDYLFRNVIEVLKNKGLLGRFDFKYSYNNYSFVSKYGDCSYFRPINIQQEKEEIIENYDLILSVHCKQIFPKELVDKVLCINIHPGYNPYNRGWFPHVFSINNKLPAGATLHLMDEKIDHGPIIDQEQIEINEWETSFDVYNRILKLEVEIINRNIEKLLCNDFGTKEIDEEGNINLKRDFDNLCELDLNERLTMREAIDRLRSLTHGDYKNAYFFDSKGNKVYVKIILEKS